MMMLTSLAFFAMFMAPDMEQAPRSSAALFSDGQYENNAALVPPLKTVLAETGYDVTEIDGQALIDANTFAPGRFSLLVLPDAAQLPMRSTAPIKSFLEQGGDLLVLNAPAWRARMIYVNNEWTTPEAFRIQNAAEPAPNVFLNFANESLDQWNRSAARASSKAQYTLVPDGPAPGIAALEANLPEMESWDSACRLLETTPFPEGHTVTVFSAKGGPGTNRLAVEWRERDGSRWLAVVPLSDQWQRYMLTPEDFKFWESVPERSTGTLNPANVDMIAFTLAYTHTGHLHGAYRFWVAQVGTAPRDAAYGDLLGDVPAPALETISPAYKFYEMNGVASINSAADQNVLEKADFPLPASALALHPRPEAGGYSKSRPWRWMPLLEAHAADGDLRGYPAVMIQHGDGEYKGGLWASYAIQDTAWYLSESGTHTLKQTLERMREPLFLLDGGANYYTYFDDQEVCLGATIVNSGTITEDAVSLLIEVKEDSGKVIERVSWSDLTFPGNTSVPFEKRWKPEAWIEAGYRVKVTLSRGERAIDTAEHPIYCWRPRKEKSFVTVDKGNFMLEGKRWVPHGVNYMPSSGIGTEWWHYFENWVGAAAYHPKVIQRDLERCVAMGMNSLSIFINRESMEAQNLLDLLRRMDALGLKANVSLRPGTPMEFPWDSVRELIEYYRLAENDTVFAYDLAWEPQFRPSERDPFNPVWEAWIIERYGNVENAERDWGYPLPRDEKGAVLNCTPQMLAESGPWDKMIAAYRRFLDTLLYEKYASARRLVRSIDPNHLVSFRMSMAGDPTDRNPNAILYDFAYLAGAVDLFEPEGYGRIGDWERVKPGWFTYEYARWANPNLPVLWAEAGVHVWDMTIMKAGEKTLEFQGQYYTDYYRMILESGADGIFWWWYPGGFRTNENSDYGIIHPDGTDRPVTRVIRDHAERVAKAPDARPVDRWLTFDRDQHHNGLTGIYDSLQQEFWDAIAAGKTPGLRTEGTGSDSTNCPALAVGNTPWTGNNPPKYLDAFFDVIEIFSNEGKWERVVPKGSITVSGDVPIQVRLTVTNLGEATLITPVEAGNLPGGVTITVTGDLKQEVPLPQRLHRFEETKMELTLAETSVEKTTEVILGLDAEGRTSFGPKFTFTLVPGV